jgi:hypothetical protein
MYPDEQRKANKRKSKQRERQIKGKIKKKEERIKCEHTPFTFYVRASK